MPGKCDGSSDEITAQLIIVSDFPEGTYRFRVSFFPLNYKMPTIILKLGSLKLEFYTKQVN